MVRDETVGQLSSSANTGVRMGILADRESRLLIDGELVAGSAGTFGTVNPATEEVLGVAADASTDDMGRAIEAARRNVVDPRAQIVWTDIRDRGAGPEALDFIVMNPPFHDGGVEDHDLGRLFLQRAADALLPGGICLVVANRHLPYEAVMHPLFNQITPLVQTGGYKVYQGRK